MHSHAGAWERENNLNSKATSLFDVQCWTFDVGRSSFNRLRNALEPLYGFFLQGLIITENNARSAASATADAIISFHID